MDRSEELASRIMTAARAKGFRSERALCLAAGLNPSFIRHMRSGRIRTPKAENIQKVATLLGVTTDWLLYGEGRTATKMEGGDRVTILDALQLADAIRIVRQAQAKIGPAAADLPPEVEAGFLRIAYEGVRDKSPEDLVQDILLYLGRIGLADLTARASGA